MLTFFVLLVSTSPVWALSIKSCSLSVLFNLPIMAAKLMVVVAPLPLETTSPLTLVFLPLTVNLVPLASTLPTVVALSSFEPIVVSPPVAVILPATEPLVIVKVLALFTVTAPVTVVFDKETSPPFVVRLLISLSLMLAVFRLPEPVFTLPKFLAWLIVMVKPFLSEPFTAKPL